VANRVCALFGRAEVRDYVDVGAILTSGQYTEDELLDLASDHDPGFDQPRFAEALAAIDRLPDSLFQPYGMSLRSGRFKLISARGSRAPQGFPVMPTAPRADH